MLSKDAYKYPLKKRFLKKGSCLILLDCVYHLTLAWYLTKRQYASAWQFRTILYRNKHFDHLWSTQNDHPRQATNWWLELDNASCELLWVITFIIIDGQLQKMVITDLVLNCTYYHWLTECWGYNYQWYCNPNCEEPHNLHLSRGLLFFFASPQTKNTFPTKERKRLR